jgi:hypothetical protein
MANEFHDTLAEHARGKSFLQLGLRARVEDNVGVLAASLGAARVGVVAHGGDLALARKIVRAALGHGSEAQIHETMVETVIVGKDDRRVDVAFCDDLLFRVEDPCRTLAGLRRLVRERLFICTNVLPTQPPPGLANGSWPIESGFLGFAGTMSAEERDSIAYVFRAYGLDASPYADGAPAIPDGHGFLVPEGSWRWFWTEESLIDLVESAGFWVEDLRYVWTRIGLLLTCR